MLSIESWNEHATIMISSYKWKLPIRKFWEVFHILAYFAGDKDIKNIAQVLGWTLKRPESKDRLEWL